MTKYNKITPEIAEKLQAIVGAKRFFAKDAVKDDFSHDEIDRKSTRLNSSHNNQSRMPSSA